MGEIDIEIKLYDRLLNYLENCRLDELVDISESIFGENDDLVKKSRTFLMDENNG